MYEQRIEHMQRTAQQIIEVDRLTAQKRSKRNQIKRGKMEQRAHSFEDMAARNRRVHERGVELNKILNDFSRKQNTKPFIFSPLIILRRPDESTPDVGLVGNITDHSSSRGNIHRYNLRVVNVNQIDDIEKGWPKSSEEIRSIGFDRQELYGVASDHNSDEIMCLAKERSPGRSFSPISALRRHMLHKRVDVHLEDMESMITMFEQAAAHPYLNPQLVPFFEQAETESLKA